MRSTAGATFVFATQGFGFAFQAVAGGRFAAVGAVHIEPLFEFRDAGFQLGEEFTNGIQPTRIEGDLDYRTQGFSSVAQHSIVINTQEIT